MIDINVEVQIEPKGAERPRARVLKPGMKRRRGNSTVVVMNYTADVYTKTTDINWQKRFARALAPFFPPEPIAEDLRVDWTACLQRPKSRCRRKDTDGLEWAGVKPDRDNIDKNILDALGKQRLRERGPLIADDNRVVCGHPLCCYGPKHAGPSINIRIRSASAFDPTRMALALGTLPEWFHAAGIQESFPPPVVGVDAAGSHPNVAGDGSGIPNEVTR